MKIKNGVNIMLFAFITLFIGILSCSRSSKNQTSGLLLQTDKDFSAMSVKEGMNKAYLHFMADERVILRNNSFPDKERKSLTDRFLSRSDSSFVVSREPLFEKISSCGDLGYTYGIRTNTNKITGEVIKGTYVTIWQKQSDGSWKFILDAGMQGLTAVSE